jgi:hypothetical protein
MGDALVDLDEVGLAVSTRHLDEHVGDSRYSP